MSAEAVGAAGLTVLVGLLLLGCPVGVAMILIGVGGFAAIVGPAPALGLLEKSVIDVATNHGFTLIPLFLLMGALAARAGLSRDLFDAAGRLTGRWAGGPALAGVTASAAFSAVSGSSLATASAITRIAWPEMRRIGQDPRLGAGSLAAGGTLGIMIPPSIALLLYALITEQSVGALFLAGLLPGLLAFLLYAACVAVMAQVWRNGQPVESDGSAGAARTVAAAGTRASAVRQLGPVVLLFGAVMGGLYGGIFTPTEAGGAGAAIALVIALVRGVGPAGIVGALRETVTVTAALFVILIGAEVLGYLLSISRIPMTLAGMVEDAGWTPWQIMAAVLVFYVLLGCVMESLAMILLTVPVVFPIVTAAGFDPVWFGVICVVAVELGLITPPMGLNLFVVRSAAPGLELRTVMVGVLPFVATDILRLAILLAVPGLSLWLPRAMGY